MIDLALWGHWHWPWPERSGCLKTFQFGKGDWRSFEQAVQREWLVTNGLGGYASSTIIGANTRKYHGLLVAALTPPVGRTMLLAKIDESYVTGNTSYNLATNQTVGGVTEFGHVHLQRVLVQPFPTFIYSFSDIILEKTVFMPHMKNCVAIVYKVKNGAQQGTLRLVPFTNCRDFHWTVRRGQINFVTEQAQRGVLVRAAPGVPYLRLWCDSGAFVPGSSWFEGMFYAAEQERGEPPEEDHYLPGHFEIVLAPNEEKIITVLASIDESCADTSGLAMLEAEKKRLLLLEEQAGYRDSLARTLVVAADAFVVHRQSTGNKSVIAGYPWFNDWGRDTMIALPGLTLVTGRFEDAREILLTFARYCKDGLLPNMFADAGHEPLYNTVDASLWYFYAVHKYLEYTGDTDFILKNIYPVLKEIAHSHIKGTHFNIKMDEDGLMAAGSPEHQLTWMDAKVDHWVVTPRHGKPVEISALWYNAIRVLENLCIEAGDSFPWPGLADKVKESFNKKFWCQRVGYYYDVVGEGGKDEKLRPNQVIAMALPYTPVSPERARLALVRVWQELYATYGLRSLSNHDPQYRGTYRGDRVRRDGAYHQGTVWSWLIGPFVTALRKAHNQSEASLIQARQLMEPFRQHLNQHGVGYISEIFDGNEPIIPNGCIAQAWGVAEVLRAYVEDVLEIRAGNNLD